MTTDSKLGQIAMRLIFPIVFNIVFFLMTGLEHLPSEWIAYGFLHVAYIAVMLIPLMGERSASAAVFSYTLYGTGLVYLVIEFLISIIIFCVRPKDLALPTAIQVVCFGIFLFVQLGNREMNRTTSNAESTREKSVARIKQLAFRVRTLDGVISDAQLNKRLAHSFDLLNASPVASPTVLQSYDAALEQAVANLEDAVRMGDVPLAKECCAAVDVAANNRVRALQVLH